MNFTKFLTLIAFTFIISLSATAQTQLVTEKALLDSLVVKINHLIDVSTEISLFKGRFLI